MRQSIHPWVAHTHTACMCIRFICAFPFYLAFAISFFILFSIWSTLLGLMVVIYFSRFFTYTQFQSSLSNKLGKFKLNHTYIPFHLFFLIFEFVGVWMCVCVCWVWRSYKWYECRKTHTPTIHIHNFNLLVWTIVLSSCSLFFFPKHSNTRSDHTNIPCIVLR